MNCSFYKLQEASNLAKYVENGLGDPLSCDALAVNFKLDCG